MNFFILVERGAAPPVEHTWHRKNARGVTFRESQREQAERWIRDALLAKCTVFRSTRRRFGLAAGRGLTDYPDDIDDGAER